MDGGIAPIKELSRSKVLRLLTLTKEATMSNNLIHLHVYVLSCGQWGDSYIVGIFAADKIKKAIKDTRAYMREHDVYEHLSVEKVPFNTLAKMPC
jgi:hypothetical protein